MALSSDKRLPRDKSYLMVQNYQWSSDKRLPCDKTSSDKMLSSDKTISVI